MLGRIGQQTPDFFEDVVLDVLRAIGSGGSREDAAERLGRSGDGGVDGVIREDKLGLDLIYVQAKRWTNTVGRPDIPAVRRRAQRPAGNHGRVHHDLFLPQGGP